MQYRQPGGTDALEAAQLLACGDARFIRVHLDGQAVAACIRAAAACPGRCIPGTCNMPAYCAVPVVACGCCALQQSMGAEGQTWCPGRRSWRCSPFDLCMQLLTTHCCEQRVILYISLTVGCTCIYGMLGTASVTCIVVPSSFAWCLVMCVFVSLGGSEGVVLMGAMALR